jgi:hypothetical protein
LHHSPALAYSAKSKRETGDKVMLQLKEEIKNKTISTENLANGTYFFYSINN